MSTCRCVCFARRSTIPRECRMRHCQVSLCISKRLASQRIALSTEKKKNPNVTTEVLALLCSPASMLYYRRKIAHFTWTTAGCCGGAQTVVVAAPRFWGATLRDANKIEAFAEKSYGSIRKKRVDRPSKSCATSCLVDEIVGWEVSREEPRRGAAFWSQSSNVAPSRRAH
jgi:hypothetical protein